MSKTMTTEKLTLGQRLKSIFFNEFRLAMIAFGTVSIFFYPIAMAVAAKDMTYLYIGIAAWALFGFGLYGIYRRFRPYIRETLCGKTSSKQ